MSTPDRNLCGQCGSLQFDGIVEYGSYILRCSKCGESLVATSFLAFSSLDAYVTAYWDPGPLDYCTVGPSPTPVGESTASRLLLDDPALHTPVQFPHD